MKLVDGSIRVHFLLDHRRLDELSSQLLTAFEMGDRKTAIENWSALEPGLIAHMEIEEKYLVPFLLRASARDARAIVQEHHHIRGRLGEIRASIESGRVGIVRAFIDELRAHARHEDVMLYELGDALIDPTARTAVFAAFDGSGSEPLEKR